MAYIITKRLNDDVSIISSKSFLMVALVNDTETCKVSTNNPTEIFMEKLYTELRVHSKDTRKLTYFPDLVEVKMTLVLNENNMPNTEAFTCKDYLVLFENDTTGHIDVQYSIANEENRKKLFCIIYTDLLAKLPKFDMEFKHESQAGREAILSVSNYLDIFNPFFININDSMFLKCLIQKINNKQLTKQAGSLLIDKTGGLEFLSDDVNRTMKTVDKIVKELGLTISIE